MSSGPVLADGASERTSGIFRIFWRRAGRLLHVRPPLTLANSSVRKGPTSYMTAADSFLNFVEEIVNFAGVNALEVGPCE